MRPHQVISQVDGPTEPTDLDKTEQNKALVTRFINEVLATGDYERLDEFIIGDGRYVQHNPDMPDGIEPLCRFAVAAGLRYIDLHKVIGCGSFVAALAESEFSGTRHAVIDLFRIENGLIVEHWDGIEPITPEDTWVNSGEF